MVEPLRSQLSARGLGSEHGGPFDFGLEHTEYVLLIGSYGSGKGLFMRLVADLNAGTGSARLNGRERDSCTAPKLRSLVSYQNAEPTW